MSKVEDNAGLCVLVIEDEDLMRRFLHKLLEEAGYSVIEAKTAAGALEQSRSATPDLILMDYVLPDMNGLQLLEAIRSQTPSVRVPIICLTGKSDIPTKMEALENGAVDYVTKPFDRRELLARITRHIQLKDQIKETETRLAQAALQDPLTGLGNRKRFSQRLSTILGAPQRIGRDALMFIDVDEFRLINDTKGHAAGDQALKSLADNLRRAFTDPDAIYRVGGDEFCIILHDLDSKQALELGQQLMLQIRTGLSGFAETDLTLSAGIAAIEPGIGMEELVSRVDSALYAAKAAGKNQCMVYQSDSEDIVTIRSESEWYSRIKEAIRLQRFQMVYQPVVELRTGKLYCQEALIRYIGDNGLRHLPGEFLPAAERFSLMPEIDQYVIRRVLAELATQSGEKIAINLSGQSIGRTDLYEFIKTALEESNVEPRRVIFEITETVFIKNLERAHLLVTELQKIGCTFCLDDFGAGFSSLSYMRNLPVDVVKIDGAFLKNIESNPVDFALLQSINEIAHLLGKRTVAEHVNSESIRQLLEEIGIDYGQGYYLGRPEPRSIAECGSRNAECEIRDRSIAD
jgi:diguanylate cyclase (GGDEF)-like protein